MNQPLLLQLKNYCAYQERSHYQVRTKLLECGARGDELEEIIAALIEENYLNEVRFAEVYAGGKFRISKWGRVKIKQGLKQHFVSDYCIKKGLAQINEIDYRNALQKLAQTKWTSLKNERSKINKMNKLKNFLLQRGFENKLVMEVVVEWSK
jgi:regulatory protein